MTNAFSKRLPNFKAAVGLNFAIICGFKFMVAGMRAFALGTDLEIPPADSAEMAAKASIVPHAKKRR